MSLYIHLHIIPTTQNDSISGSVVGAGGAGGGVGHGSVGGGHGGSGYKDSLSSLPQAAFNYINSIVGSGVIGIPYAFHKAGFGVGLLLLAFVAVITDYSLILMVRIGHHLHCMPSSPLITTHDARIL